MTQQSPQTINQAMYEVDEGDCYGNYCEDCLLRVNDGEVDLSDVPRCPSDTWCVECLAFAAGVHPDGKDMRREQMIGELLDLCGQDVFTDAHEYSERVGRIQELVAALEAGTSVEPAGLLDSYCVDCGEHCYLDGSLAVLCPKCDGPQVKINDYNEPCGDCLAEPGKAHKETCFLAHRENYE